MITQATGRYVVGGNVLDGSVKPALLAYVCVFFFSSRRRHTRCSRDWSSDVCSSDLPLDVEPIAVDSTDEIGEVARAFDQVHREAVRLASNEAALRGNVNAMFVNLSQIGRASCRERG